MLLVVLALVTIIRGSAAKPESEARIALDKLAIMAVAARVESTFDAGNAELRPLLRRPGREPDRPPSLYR